MSHSLLGTRIQRFFGGSTADLGRTRRRPAKRFSLAVEPLEGRALLATVTVDVVDDSFTPSNVTIHVGDTVHWVWQGNDAHTTTSVRGSPETWDSLTKNFGSTFDQPFSQAGTFAYFCRFHGRDNGNGTASGMSGTVTVTAATIAPLQSITIDPPNPTIAADTTQEFTAIGTRSDNSTVDLTSQVTWDSAILSVATIDATTGLATGVSAGTSRISARMGSITGSTTLTVSAATLRSIAITPANPSVAAGTTQQFTAMGTFSDNRTQDLTSQVTWTSATPAVATINAVGLATGVAQGTTTISASMNGVPNSTTLTVTPAMHEPTPMLASEHRVLSGAGRRRKLVGFDLVFNTPLNTAEAENVGHYQVVQPGRTRRSRPSVVRVLAAHYDPVNNAVRLTTGKFNAKKMLTLTATGLVGAMGTPAVTIVTRL